MIGVAVAAALLIFEPLIGDQWVSVARLPDGQEMRSRTVWSWGSGKRSVRMRQFVLGKRGEVQRYETIVYHHPTENRTLYRVFAEAGELSRGTVRGTKEGIVLQQPAKAAFPAMRTLYSVSRDGICTTRISFSGEQGWVERIKTVSRRLALTPARKLRLEGGVNPLQPVAALVDKKQWCWSLHHRLLRGVLADGSEVYVTFDPRSGALSFLEVAADGTVREGAVTAPDKSRLEFTVAGKWRRVFVIPKQGARESWTEIKRGDAWKREQPAKKRKKATR